MTINEIREYIYKILMQNFAQDSVIFDNQKAQDINPTKHYIQLTLDDIDKNILEIGGRPSLITGKIIFKVLTPEGFGLSKCFDVIGKIEQLFFNVSQDGFYFGAMQLKRNGLEESFFSFDVSITFEYEVF